MAYEIKAASYTIHGPVKGSHDLHPSYTVYKDDGPVLASFYAADGDLEAAVARAEAFCDSASAIAKLEAECFALSAGVCPHKLGNEHGNAYCAKTNELI